MRFQILGQTLSNEIHTHTQKLPPDFTLQSADRQVIFSAVVTVCNLLLAERDSKSRVSSKEHNR